MSNATTTEPQTTQEQKLAEPCEREHCTHDTTVQVPVQVADIEQEWCPDCVSEEFGLDWAEYQERQESPLRFVTPETVAAFCVGFLVMFLIASIVAV